MAGREETKLADLLCVDEDLASIVGVIVRLKLQRRWLALGEIGDINP